jgi:hypothetical protein
MISRSKAEILYGILNVRSTIKYPDGGRLGVLVPRCLRMVGPGSIPGAPAPSSAPLSPDGGSRFDSWCPCSLFLAIFPFLFHYPLPPSPPLLPFIPHLPPSFPALSILSPCLVNALIHAPPSGPWPTRASVLTSLPFVAFRIEQNSWCVFWLNHQALFITQLLPPFAFHPSPTPLPGFARLAFFLSTLM